MNLCYVVQNLRQGGLVWLLLVEGHLLLSLEAGSLMMSLIHWVPDSKSLQSSIQGVLLLESSGLCWSYDFSSRAKTQLRGGSNVTVFTWSCGHWFGSFHHSLVNQSHVLIACLLETALNVWQADSLDLEVTSMGAVDRVLPGRGWETQVLADDLRLVRAKEVVLLHDIRVAHVLRDW